MKIQRAYKYRLHPTPEQEARLSAWVAAVRTIYNAALDQRKWYGRAAGTDPHGRDSRFNSVRQSREIGTRKLSGDDELQWITDAPASAFINALRDLDKAFNTGKHWPRGWHMNVVFGQEYAATKDFKREFRRALRQVLGVYPDARIESVMGGILLKPSPPPVKRLHVAVRAITPP